MSRHRSQSWHNEEWRHWYDYARKTAVRLDIAPAFAFAVGWANGMMGREWGCQYSNLLGSSVEADRAGALQRCNAWALGWKGGYDERQRHLRDQAIADHQNLALVLRGGVPSRFQVARVRAAYLDPVEWVGERRLIVFDEAAHSAQAVQVTAARLIRERAVPITRKVNHHGPD